MIAISVGWVEQSETQQIQDQEKIMLGFVPLSEFETLMEQYGWVFRRQSSSHRLWYSPSGYRLPVQPEQGGTAKAYQVKQFLVQLKEEEK